MSEFLSPNPPLPPRILPGASESQAFPGSSVSISSDSSSNYFYGASRGSNGSTGCYTDLTTPATSQSNDGADHDLSFKPYTDDGASDVGLIKSQFASDPKDGCHNLLRSVVEQDKVSQAQDDGYTSDHEDAFDAVAVLRRRLTKSKPTANARRALRFMEKRRNPGPENDYPDDDRTQAPAVKLLVTPAVEEVEDWTHDFDLKAEPVIEPSTPSFIEEIQPARPFKMASIAEIEASLLEREPYEELLPPESALGIDLSYSFGQPGFGKKPPTAITISPAPADKSLEIEELLSQHKSNGDSDQLLQTHENLDYSSTSFQVWRDVPTTSFETAGEISVAERIVSAACVQDGPGLRVPFTKKNIPLRVSKLRDDISVPDILLQDATEGSVEAETIPREVFDGFLSGSPSLQIWVDPPPVLDNPECEQPFASLVSLDSILVPMAVSLTPTYIIDVMSPLTLPASIFAQTSHPDMGSCATLALSSSSPSLCFDSTLDDSSISISSLGLSSPQHLQLEVARISSPIIYSESFNNGHLSLASPVVAISTMIFTSRGIDRLPPVTQTLTGDDLDVASLMRLEVAASRSQHQHAQVAAQNTGSGSTIASPSPIVYRAAALVGLGMDIPPLGMPESDFPSFCSSTSFRSLANLAEADGQISVAEDDVHFFWEKDDSDQSINELDIPSIPISGSDAVEWGRLIDIPSDAPMLSEGIFVSSPGPMQYEEHLEQDVLPPPLPSARTSGSTPEPAIEEPIAEEQDLGVKENNEKTSLHLSLSIGTESIGAIITLPFCPGEVSNDVPPANIAATETIGLGLGSLIEARLQSSSSISRLRSPEQLPVTGILLDKDPSEEASSLGAVARAGREQSCVNSEGIQHNLSLSIDISKPQDLSGEWLFEETSRSEIEPVGALSFVQQQIHRYSSNIDRWRRVCSESEQDTTTMPRYSPSFESRPLLGHKPNSGVEPLEAAPLMDLTEANIKHMFSSPHLYTPLSPQHLPQFFAGECVRQALSPVVQPLLQENNGPPHIACEARILHVAPARASPSRFSPRLKDLASSRPLSPSGRLSTPLSDPRSPVSPSHSLHAQPSRFLPNSPSPSLLASILEESGSFCEPKDSDQVLEHEKLRLTPSCISVQTDIATNIPSSQSSSRLSASKSIEGVGMGLPSDLASRPPRQRDISSDARIDGGLAMMSTAEECQNIADLSLDSPASDSGLPTFMTSEMRGGSRHFFKIPKFAKRHLYAISEHPSPPLTQGTSSSGGRTPSSRTRLLSTTWSDIANLIRSPSKPGQSWFKSSPRTTPVDSAAGSSAHSPLSPSSNDESCPLVPGSLPTSKPVDTSPKSPVFTPKSNLFSIMSRLPFSGSSTSRAASPSNDPVGVTSPGVIEHVDAPRNTGILKSKTKKESRFGPAIRKFQLLF